MSKKAKTQPTNTDQKALFLEQLSLCRSYAPRERRISTLHVLKQSFGCKDFSENDIFMAAYLDPQGRDYWSGWLNEDWMTAHQIIDFLSSHNARAIQGNERASFLQSLSQHDPSLLALWTSARVDPLAQKCYNEVVYAFSVAANNEEDWIRGQSGDLKRATTAVHIGDTEFQQGPAIRWLFKHVDFNHLVPINLRKLIEYRIVYEGRSLGGSLNKGGRPVEHDWDGAFAYLGWYLASCAEMPEKVDLRRTLEDWFVKYDGGAPKNDREISKRISKIYDALADLHRGA